jgi:hypothetical protein
VLFYGTYGRLNFRGSSFRHHFYVTKVNQTTPNLSDSRLNKTRGQDETIYSG